MHFLDWGGFADLGNIYLQILSSKIITMYRKNLIK